MLEPISGKIRASYGSKSRRKLSLQVGTGKTGGVAENICLQFSYQYTPYGETRS